MTSLTLSLSPSSSPSSASAESQLVLKRENENKKIAEYKTTNATVEEDGETWEEPDKRYVSSEIRFFYVKKAANKKTSKDDVKNNAFCLICGITRQSKKVWSWQTSPRNLRLHLGSHHKDWQVVKDLVAQHEKEEKEKQRKQTDKLRQTSLQVQHSAVPLVWGPGDQRTKSRDMEIVEELLEDGVPLSHVERSGFAKRVKKCYPAEYPLPTEERMKASMEHVFTREMDNLLVQLGLKNNEGKQTPIPKLHGSSDLWSSKITGGKHICAITIGWVQKFQFTCRPIIIAEYPGKDQDSLGKWMREKLASHSELHHQMGGISTMFLLL